MNTVAILNTQFVQVALPIVFTLFLAAWLNNRSFDSINKRFDDMNRRFDEVIKRLDKIDDVLRNFGERIVKLEERMSPFSHR